MNKHVANKKEKKNECRGVQQCYGGAENKNKKKRRKEARVGRWTLRLGRFEERNGSGRVRTEPVRVTYKQGVRPFLFILNKNFSLFTLSSQIFLCSLPSCVLLLRREVVAGGSGGAVAGRLRRRRRRFKHLLYLFIFASFDFFLPALCFSRPKTPTYQRYGPRSKRKEKEKVILSLCYFRRCLYVVTYDTVDLWLM